MITFLNKVKAFETHELDEMLKAYGLMVDNKIECKKDAGYAILSFKPIASKERLTHRLFVKRKDLETAQKLLQKEFSVGE